MFLVPGGIPIRGPPKVCKIMAFMAIIMGLGPGFDILLGFGYLSTETPGV